MNYEYLNYVNNIFDLISLPVTMKNYYGKLMTLLSSECKSSSRSQPLLRSYNVSACRYWQLVYMLFYVYNNKVNDKLIEDIKNKNSTKIDLHLQKICNMHYKIAYPDTDNKLANIYNKIIFHNIVNVDYIIEIDTFDSIKTKTINNSINNYQNFCLCLYYKGFDSDILYISHFFTIIFKDDNYYITSAFGSDEVRISQYTTKLSDSDIDVFNKLCKNLKTSYNENHDDTTPKELKEITDLFENIFLKNISPTTCLRYNEEHIENNPKLQKLRIDPSIGVPNTLNRYINSEKEINIGFITKYQEFIENIYDIYLYNKIGGKKTKKYKKTKRKKTKRKKTKRKKTKRNQKEGIKNNRKS